MRTPGANHRTIIAALALGLTMLGAGCTSPNRPATIDEQLRKVQVFRGVLPPADDPEIPREVHVAMNPNYRPVVVGVFQQGRLRGTRYLAPRKRGIIYEGRGWDYDLQPVGISRQFAPEIPAALRGEWRRPPGRRMGLRGARPDVGLLAVFDDDGLRFTLDRGSTLADDNRYRILFTSANPLAPIAIHRQMEGQVFELLFVARSNVHPGTFQIGIRLAEDPTLERGWKIAIGIQELESVSPPRIVPAPWRPQAWLGTIEVMNVERHPIDAPSLPTLAPLPFEESYRPTISR